MSFNRLRPFVYGYEKRAPDDEKRLVNFPSKVSHEVDVRDPTTQETERWQIAQSGASDRSQRVMRDKMSVGA
jgi:hypothetical protein